MGDVAGFYREPFRAFTCGTAHRPFPTVSLVGGRFQPGNSKDGRLSTFGEYMGPRLSHKNCQLSIVHCPLSIFPAVPYGFADWYTFSTRVYQMRAACSIVQTAIAKIKRPSRKNCQLSIVNSKNNFQLIHILRCQY